MELNLQLGIFTRVVEAYHESDIRAVNYILATGYTPCGYYAHLDSPKLTGEQKWYLSQIRIAYDNRDVGKAKVWAYMALGMPRHADVVRARLERARVLGRR